MLVRTVSKLKHPEINFEATYVKFGNAVPIKEIPIKPEAVQLELLQPQGTENIENTQDSWEVFKVNVVASGQALGYPNNGLSDK
ncbi:38568_t:CDS:2 [Gigaspora margarita]|uniref:38568_t:CDS:1 n=1 Tax=Gigaspora margarita TaxID=4874 RepID=A0ABN7VN18_GIGMA|nr:38568_t:CDS:2 [Gigaspora margarita]